MNALQMALRRIEQVAEELRKAIPELTLPESGYTLPDADAKLRAALGNDAGLRIEVLPDYLGGGRKVEYSAWDGRKWYEAPTLDGAVNQCLQAHVEAPPGDPVKAAGELLTATPADEDF